MGTQSNHTQKAKKKTNKKKTRICHGKLITWAKILLMVQLQTVFTVLFILYNWEFSLSDYTTSGRRKKVEENMGEGM